MPHFSSNVPTSHIQRCIKTQTHLVLILWCGRFFFSHFGTSSCLWPVKCCRQTCASCHQQPLIFTCRGVAVAAAKRRTLTGFPPASAIKLEVTPAGIYFEHLQWWMRHSDSMSNHFESLSVTKTLHSVLECSETGFYNSVKLPQYNYYILHR